MTHDSMAKVTSVSTRQTRDTEQPMYVMDESAIWCSRVSCVGSRADASARVQIPEARGDRAPAGEGPRAGAQLTPREPLSRRARGGDQQVLPLPPDALLPPLTRSGPLGQPLDLHWNAPLEGPRSDSSTPPASILLMPNSCPPTPSPLLPPSRAS